MRIGTAIAVLLTLIVDRASARNYDIVFVGVEGYEANPQYVNAAESFIRVRRVDKSVKPGLFHTITLVKPLPNNTIIEATLYEVRDNKLLPSWLKYKSNFAEYILHEKRPIFDELARLYHFKCCPVQGVYKIENWQPDDRLLPPVLPGPDKMMFGVKLYSGATSIMKYGVVFLVDRSKGTRGSPGGKTRRVGAVSHRVPQPAAAHHRGSAPTAAALATAALQTKNSSEGSRTVE